MALVSLNYNYNRFDFMNLTVDFDQIHSLNQIWIRMQSSNSILNAGKFVIQTNSNEFARAYLNIDDDFLKSYQYCEKANLRIFLLGIIFGINPNFILHACSVELFLLIGHNYKKNGSNF